MLFVIALFAILWFTNQIDQREKEISYKEFCSLIEDGGECSGGTKQECADGTSGC